jgi:preprotein translocase subunit YajC
MKYGSSCEKYLPYPNKAVIIKSIIWEVYFMDQYLPLIMLGVLIVVYYFILIKPQRKKEQQIKAMRDSLAVGDEVITIGGFVGRVVSVKDDDTLVIEVGADKTKLKLMKWGISVKTSTESNQD